MMDNELRIFSGTGNPKLARHICEHLNVEPGAVTIESFPDGETFLTVHDDVRGRDCFVVQSTCPPVNDNLMELLIFIDCLRRASARRITAVIPYFGYARQDRKTEGRTPITAKLVANMITAAGADRVLTMNLHADQIPAFFDIPVDHLTATPVICNYFRSLNLDMSKTVLVSPDVGNIKTTNTFANLLGGELAIVDKRRISGDQADARAIIGDVQGKDVLMFDDMITTAGTVTQAVKLVRAHGARDVYVGVTHAVLAESAFGRLEEASLAQLCVTDTIPLTDDALARLSNVHVLSVADLLGEAIRRIHRHESISALFK